MCVKLEKKGHLRIAERLLNPSVSKGLDAAGTHYISSLWMRKAASRLHVVTTPRFSAYLRVLFYRGPLPDSY